jgi:ABC-2 type transport system permease protein
VKTLCVLVKPQFLSLKNRLSHSGGKETKRAWILILVGATFLVGLFTVCCRVLFYFQSVDIIGHLLARHLLGMVLLTLFSLLVFSHIVTALSNLYLSKDLELCHSTPVGIDELFVSRAMITFFESSWMLIVFGIPVFTAYGYVYRAGPIFFLGVLHLNVAMAVIASGIGFLITMFIVYGFPARKARDVVMLLSIIMAVVLYMLFRFLRPERLVNPEAFFGVVRYLDYLKGAESPYLPPQWITVTLWDYLTNPGQVNHLFHILLTWMTAAALIVMNVWAASVLYYDGFSRSQEAKQRRLWGKRILAPVVSWMTRPFGQDLAVVMAKDAKTFFRDNTQWSQLLLLGAIVVVYVYNFSVLPFDKSPIQPQLMKNELAFLNMGLAGFVLSAVSARFVFPTISAEGEAFWIILSSPFHLSRFLWGKFLLFSIPMLLLGEGLIVLTNCLLQVTLSIMLICCVTMLFMVFGVVALGIGLGAVYPNFRHQNIAQVSTGFSGILYMIIAVLFVGVVVVLEAGPVYILLTASARPTPIGLAQWIFIAVSFGAVLIITALSVCKPISMGLKALQKAH